MCGGGIVHFTARRSRLSTATSIASNDLSWTLTKHQGYLPAEIIAVQLHSVTGRESRRRAAGGDNSGTGNYLQGYVCTSMPTGSKSAGTCGHEAFNIVMKQCSSEVASQYDAQVQHDAQGHLFFDSIVGPALLLHQ